MKKNKKIILRTIIIAIVLIVVYGFTNKSYALIGVLGVIGLGAIFIYAAQLFMLAIGLIGQGIMTSLTDDASKTGGSVLRNIFFNHSSLTTASFFNGIGMKDGNVWKSGDVMFNISQKVSQYYYVLRNLAIAILLFVLLYIAIRMATSTLSEREARYKKMLTNWAVSLALVFVLHYIMVVTFYVNNTLVSILEDTMGDDVVLNTASLVKQGLVPIAGFGESLIFMILIGMEITFLFMYIKRILVLSFLMLIAPLITITYSIDKIADGKHQALNTWLKEFIYNVIIQPFHCILYITLIQTAVDSMTDREGIGGFIIYIIVLQFVKEAENIIKKIFSIQADSMPGMQGMGALALGAVTALGSKAKGEKSSNKSNRMPKMKDESGKKKTKTQEEKGKKNNEQDEKRKVEAGANQKNNTKGTTNNQTKNTNNGQQSNTTGAQQSTDRGETSGSETNSAPSVISTANISSGSEPQSQEGHGVGSYLAKKGRRIAGGFTGAYKFAAGNDGGVKDFLKNSAKVGVTLAGTGVGLGMGNLNDAIGLGMTAYGVSNKIDNAIDDYKSDRMLEENEDEFTEQYAEYVHAYRQTVNPNATEEQIRQNLNGVIDSYEDHTLKYDSIQDERERELKRKFIENSYSKMKKTLKVKGDDNASDSIKTLTQSKGAQKYKKLYGSK